VWRRLVTGGDDDVDADSFARAPDSRRPVRPPSPRGVGTLDDVLRRGERVGEQLDRWLIAMFDSARPWCRQRAVLDARHVGQGRHAVFFPAAAQKLLLRLGISCSSSSLSRSPCLCEVRGGNHDVDTVGFRRRSCNPLELALEFFRGEGTAPSTPCPARSRRPPHRRNG